MTAPKPELDPTTPLSELTPAHRKAIATFQHDFNSGRYYEAHDALEPLWLTKRGTADGLLLQGLIQLTAAFVHVQKDRSVPALSLLTAARRKLETLPNPLPATGSHALRLTAVWQTILSQPHAQPSADLTTHPPRLPS